jgi:hypothetical protein
MNEMLEALNQAIKETPWWLPNTPALELVGKREVLGQLGDRVDSGDLGIVENALDDTGRPTYSFTRSQCKQMRKTSRKAARHDAKRR